MWPKAHPQDMRTFCDPEPAAENMALGARPDTRPFSKFLGTSSAGDLDDEGESFTTAGSASPATSNRGLSDTNFRLLVERACNLHETLQVENERLRQELTRLRGSAATVLRQPGRDDFVVGQASTEDKLASASSGLHAIQKIQKLQPEQPSAKPMGPDEAVAVTAHHVAIQGIVNASEAPRTASKPLGLEDTKASESLELSPVSEKIQDTAAEKDDRCPPPERPRSQRGVKILGFIENTDATADQNSGCGNSSPRSWHADSERGQQDEPEVKRRTHRTTTETSNVSSGRSRVSKRISASFKNSIMDIPSDGNTDLRNQVSQWRSSSILRLLPKEPSTKVDEDVGFAPGLGRRMSVTGLKVLQNIGIYHGFVGMSSNSEEKEKETPQVIQPDANKAQQDLLCWFHQQEADERARTETEDRCMLSPVHPVRLAWDVVWSVVLLVDLWLLSIQFVFLPDENKMPEEVLIVMQVAMVFFLCDIVMNCFTGFQKGNVLVMDRTKVLLRYLTFWFWIDIVATVPFDLLFLEDDSGNNTLRTTKTAKASKSLRSLKLLKTLRIAKAAASMRSRQMHAVDFTMKRRIERVERLAKLASADSGLCGWLHNKRARFAQKMDDLGETIGRPLLYIAALVVMAHVHACFYALLQPNWTTESQDFREALSRYSEAYWWSYTVLTFGTYAPADTLGLWILELVMATERVVFVGFALITLLVQVFCQQEEDARLNKKSAILMEYLNTRAVSTQTQLQVMYSVKETGVMRKEQQSFNALLQNELPEELRRGVCEELWTTSLMTMSLLEIPASWDARFLPELSQVVREELYASKVSLFCCGDAVLTAYFILEGTISVIPRDKVMIPNFSTNNWLGEKAFVSLDSRSDAIALTRSMCRLLACTGADFRQVLENLGLMNRFQNLCGEELWRGLCGRCGALGDHFAKDCPLIWKRSKRSRVAGRMKRKRSSNVNSQSGDSSSDEDKVVIAQDLQVYLKHAHLDRIARFLESSDIDNLEALETCQLESVIEKLQLALHAFGEEELTDDEVKRLAPGAIEAFRCSQKENVMRSMKSRDLDHFMFLSHYKLEAGTEAALMRGELEKLIDKERPEVKTSAQQSAVFLDSEDLQDLTTLRKTVRHSQYLVTLLTTGFLSRPWCLIEVVTAHCSDVPIIPVELKKPGNQFDYPGKDFYKDLTEGDFLDEPATQLLREHDVTLQQVSSALQAMFSRIALPYSPHRPTSIRNVELREILRTCSQRGGSLKSLDSGGK
eukprot:TRINITY_DN23505_c0_g1_i1.p1 TRINITY_DN23505_c0_g1~~TRINITY_DN23505_c0_g1_i1.p1  ORF type:complete len:1249 (+),score=232.02 TRINITY_DN23505_c0_g1_i1:68-3814(+)